MHIIDNELLNKLSDEARQLPRRRKNYNFHLTLDDPINRMLNAMEPDTYTPPHKHENPDKREVLIVLRGRLAVFFYDDEGKITDIILLGKENGVYGVEVPPRKWHSIVSLEAGSVVYEIKDGPYDPNNDKILASWAPAEGSNEVEKYLKYLREKI